MDWESPAPLRTNGSCCASRGRGLRGARGSVGGSAGDPLRGRSAGSQLHARLLPRVRGRSSPPIARGGASSSGSSRPGATTPRGVRDRREGHRRKHGARPRLLLPAPRLGTRLRPRGLARIVRLAFEDLGVRSLVAVIHRDNERSQATARRLGMRLDREVLRPMVNLSSCSACQAVPPPNERAILRVRAGRQSDGTRPPASAAAGDRPWRSGAPPSSGWSSSTSRPRPWPGTPRGAGPSGTRRRRRRWAPP